MDELSFEVKALADGADPGGFDAVLSTAGRDRDGEIVDARAFDPLPPSIPIHYGHDWMDGVPPVGVGEPYYDGDTLRVKARFASTPRAQELRSLVTEGIVTAMSVGYVNPRSERVDEVRHIVAGDLLEGSLTSVPVNTGARVLSAKAVAESKAGARNSASDAKMIQSVHDYATQLGASCDGTKHVEAEDVSIKAASPMHHTATDDAAWDGPAAEARLSGDASPATLRSAFAWADGSADPATKAAYRFIHHEVGTDGTVGAANVTACRTGISVLNGARGGTTIPPGDRTGVHSHLAAHLADAGVESVSPLKSLSAPAGESTEPATSDAAAAAATASGAASPADPLTKARAAHTADVAALAFGR